MTKKEREIYAMLLQICYEILPNTSMRNNKKIKESEYLSDITKYLKVSVKRIA